MCFNWCAKGVRKICDVNCVWRNTFIQVKHINDDWHKPTGYTIKGKNIKTCDVAL